jgi:hypothetical protein
MTIFKKRSSTYVYKSKTKVPCKGCGTVIRRDKVPTGYCRPCIRAGRAPEKRTIMQAFQGTTSTPTIVPDSPTHNVPPVQNAEPMQIAESLPARPTSIYPPHYLPTFPGSTTQSVEVDVLRSLQKQVVALEAVTERLTTLTVTCVSDKTANAAADGMLNVRSSAFKTVAELCVEYGYLQSDDDETIFCALCADTPQVASTVRGAAATCRNGEINLKQSIPGESGDQKRVLTLTELKKAVLRHLKSERHKFAEKLRAENEAAAKEKHDVSIAVARQAYLTVCESKSGLSYERLILNAFLLGVRVGVKQHGDDFFRQFVVSMHTVIVKGIAQFLRTPQPTTGKCPPFCIVADKLCGVFEIAEFGDPHYGKWVKGSGVDIMQYMFTTKSFYADPSKPVRNWLYLFNHCVLKARCEAVVEGMGCVLDKHADPQRHLTMDKYTAEAMIHWNGPAAHECENFLTLALNEHFKSTRMPREQRFHHTDSRQRSVYPHGTVLHRYLTAKRHKSKFPWWEPANNSP